MRRKIDLAAKVILICIWMLIFTPPVSGEPGNIEEDRWTFTPGEAWRLKVAPPERLYSPYLADLRRPTMSMTYMHLTDSVIPDAGNDRFAFMLGGQFGVLRAYPLAFPGSAFQLDLYGSFYGQFDIDSSTDNIGWDGFYGAVLSWANDGGLAARLALNHDSSHLGDEFIEETGRLRLNYTREEIAGGLSYYFRDRYRIYGEAAYAHHAGDNEYQEPWRVQGGLEYEPADRLWGGPLGCFAALDLTAYEENDWDLDVTAHVGVTAPFEYAFRTARMGLVYRKGRSLIGEFSMHREEWWGLRITMDL
ncbi:MAG: DUF1207 domain-containing protein [Thermodesulfobacteriota bacterium]